MPTLAPSAAEQAPTNCRSRPRYAASTTGAPLQRATTPRSRSAIGTRRYSTKLHTLVDPKGRPIFVAITAGQRHEMTKADELLANAPGKAFITDVNDPSRFLSSRDRFVASRIKNRAGFRREGEGWALDACCLGRSRSSGSSRSRRQATERFAEDLLGRMGERRGIESSERTLRFVLAEAEVDERSVA